MQTLEKIKTINQIIKSKIFLLCASFLLILFATPTSLFALSAKDVTITTLQTFLEQKGLLVISPTDTKGNFGPKTKIALIAYQTNIGLPAQGVFGMLTKTKIAEELSSSTPVSTTNITQSSIITPTSDKPVTENDLTNRLAGIYKMIADSQRINSLSNTTITGGSISGASISGASISGLTTDSVAEGSSNLYWTPARAASALSGTTTDAITQGTVNKYWSQNLFDSALFATTSLSNILSLPSLTSIGTSATATMFNGSVSIGSTVLTDKQQIEILCSGNVTTKLQNAINTQANAGGGVVHLSAGSCYSTAQITIPNDSQNPPHQSAIALEGAGSMRDGYWGTGVVGATVLDLRYSGSVAKIDTRGAGMLTIEDIAFVDSSTDTTPFIQTTNTTLNIHRNSFTGSGTGGSSSATDAIVLGGTTTNNNGSATAAFQGYGTIIDGNYFSKIRRGVYGRVWSNSVVVQNNTWSSNSGSDNTAAAIEFDGTTGFSTGNVVSGNLIESNGYVYGITMTNAFASGMGNSFWDPGVGTIAAFHLKGTSAGFSCDDCYLPGTSGTFQNLQDDTGANGIYFRASAGSRHWGYDLFSGPQGIQIQPEPKASSEATKLFNIARSTSLSVNVVNVTSSSSITVLRPNGGETWTKGTTQTIKWQQDPIVCASGTTCTYLRTYDISLVPYYQPCTVVHCPAYPYQSPSTIATGISGISYDWAIPNCGLGNECSSNFDILPGAYTIQVCQTGTSNCGSSGSYFNIVNEQGSTNSLPVIVGVPTVPASIAIGQSLSLSWSATDADNDDLSWSIDWGEGTGTGMVCSSVNPQNKQNWTFSTSHTWTQAGVYTVKVTVDDCKGGSDQSSFTINVGNATTPVSTAPNQLLLLVHTKI